MPLSTRITDNCSGHDSCAPRPLIEGSPNCYINGLNAGRGGDPVSCGSVVAEGSDNVFIGG